MKSNKRIHIIGGGVSGLLNAYFLQKKGFQVAVSERCRWGGLIETIQTPYGRVETAANSLLKTSLVSEVMSDLGVSMLETKPASKKRYVANERPQRLPISIPTALYSGLHFLVNKIQDKHRPRPEELLSDWACRVFHPDFENRLLRPAIRGIYGKDSRSLSASLVMGPLFQPGRERRRGSISPALGMGQLVDALLIYLRSQSVRLIEEEVSALPDSDFVLLAGSLAQKKALLMDVDPLWAKDWGRTQSQDLITVTHFYPLEKDPSPGFGIVFHPEQNWRASGVLFNHHLFENRTSVNSQTWIFEAGNLDQRAADLVIKNNRARLGYNESLPLATSYRKWENSLPLYNLELEKTLAQPNISRKKNVLLVGNDQGDIGLTGIIERAWRLANQLEQENL